MADGFAKPFFLCGFAAVTGSGLERLFAGIAFSPAAYRSLHAPTAIFGMKVEMYLASVHHYVFHIRHCFHD
jgi:hypothetical protein